MVAIVLGYYLYCVTQHYIAKKLGNNDTWMSYVPFARNIQRMRMVNMPMWKLLFVGSAFVSFTSLFSLGLIVLIGILFGSMKVALGITVGIILGLVYLVLFVIYTFEYQTKIAAKFGFVKAPYALVMMFLKPVGIVMEYMLALSDRFYVGNAAPAPVPGPAPAPAPAPDPSAIGLLGISGMYQGAKFTMKPGDEFVIGRDGTLANVIISTNGDKVSRRHCTVTFNPATCRYEVTDFSSNGTYHGNERLLKGQATPIARGTTIVIGDKMNQFKLM